MFKKWIVLFFTVAFVLTACHSPMYNQTEGNIADVKIKAAKERKRDDKRAQTQPSLLVKSGLYVDATPISLQKRPTWLNNRVVIKGAQLPFSYFTRLIATGAGSQVLTKYQAGLDQSVSMSMSYSGTLKGALDMLATKSGNVYSISQNKIYWQSFITRTYDIAFLPGDLDYMVGKKSDSGSTSTADQGSQAQVSNYTTSDASQNEYSNLSGKISIWKDLKETVTQMLSPEGKLSISQASTSITVTDRPTNVELVGRYIANLNNSLSKQVLVKVQVLEVNLSSGFNYGIDWDLVTNAFHNSPFKIDAKYGTPISISDVVGSTLPAFGLDRSLKTFEEGQRTIPAYTILLKALNQQGKTAIVTEPRVLCQNNQVCVVRITRNQGYVASIQNTSAPTTGGGGGTTNNTTVTSQVTPGLLITGFTLYVIPKIIKDKIYLSANADFSTAGKFEQFGGIQLPDVTEKHFNQRSLIKSGETLILSGLKQTRNVSGASQFLTSQALGGTAAAQVNSETVILITPILLNGNA